MVIFAIVEGWCGMNCAGLRASMGQRRPRILHSPHFSANSVVLWPEVGEDDIGGSTPGARMNNAPSDDIEQARSWRSEVRPGPMA